MLNIIHSVFLGAIQGISEFLPISSSGHLVVIPYILNWRYNGLDFDVALHFGTALALIAFFWRDWLGIFKSAFQPDTNPTPYPKNILWQIVVASIPAGIIGLAIDKYVEKNFHSVLFIAFNFAFFGVLLWYVDKKAKSSLKPAELTYKQSFLIGLSQAIALVPGISRSGITMTTSRYSGLSRENAARFSFLLGTPATLGAFLVKLPDIMKDGIGIGFWAGVATSTVLGFLAIKYLLNYLKRSDFSLFMWYRLMLATLVVAVFIAR